MSSRSITQHKQVAEISCCRSTQMSVETKAEEKCLNQRRGLAHTPPQSGRAEIGYLKKGVVSHIACTWGFKRLHRPALCTAKMSLIRYIRLRFVSCGGPMAHVLDRFICLLKAKEACLCLITCSVVKGIILRKIGEPRVMSFQQQWTQPCASEQNCSGLKRPVCFS